MSQKVITPAIADCAKCKVSAKPEEDWDFHNTWRIVCLNYKHSTKYCGTVHRATCRWNNAQECLISANAMPTVDLDELEALPND
jgi:hypothetical protein